MSVRKIVLTGGPCAGKTTLTHVLARVFHRSVVVVPEAASLLFQGGFPRWNEETARFATQRAIFQVQCELENAYESKYPDKILVMDRGTIDGAAYWSKGVDDYFKSMHTTLANELNRYQRVIYLESAAQADYVQHMKENPSRTETWEEARKLDEQTQRLWLEHPDMTIIKNQRSFGHKISEVLEIIERFAEGDRGNSLG